MVTTQDARLSKLSNRPSGLQALGVPPERGPVYELALTHRSFASEQVEQTEHNERLEFLGDAIVGAIVADLIFRTHPELAEGDMSRLRTQLVNKHALARIATEFGVGEELRLGKGEEASGGRQKASLLSNGIEAIVGAVYVDKGMERVREHLEPIFLAQLEAAFEDKVRFDAKNALQEVVVRDHGEVPSYRVVSQGPDHEKSFTAEVLFDGKVRGTGEGPSKKEAEHNAARAALGRLSGAETEALLEEGSDARAS